MDDTKLSEEISKVCELSFRKKPSAQMFNNLKAIKESVGSFTTDIKYKPILQDSLILPPKL